MSILLAISASEAGTPLGTAFSYQGRLKDAGSPANGTYDFQFSLFDRLSGGTQHGPTVCAYNVAVAEGLFTLALDFGTQFNGEERFLEIEVRTDTGLDCNNPAGFVMLAPRQELTATPYALQTRGIFVDNVGNVGIGTAMPASTLDVNGTAQVSGLKLTTDATVGELH